MNRRASDRYRRASDVMGYGFAALAAIIVLVYLVLGRAFSGSVVTLVTLLAFAGGALVQGVSLDRILRAFRGRNGEPPRQSEEVGS